MKSNYYKGEKRDKLDLINCNFYLLKNVIKQMNIQAKDVEKTFEIFSKLVCYKMMVAMNYEALLQLKKNKKR